MRENVDRNHGMAPATQYYRQIGVDPALTGLAGQKLPKTLANAGLSPYFHLQMYVAAHALVRTAARTGQFVLAWYLPGNNLWRPRHESNV